MPSPPLLVALALLSNAPKTAEREALEQVFVEGQERYEEGEFVAAAESFERLFGMVPESEENRATRENVAFNVLNAWFAAYDRQLGPSGKDIAHLERAAAFRDRYVSEFQAAYGAEASVIAELGTVFDQLDARLDDARNPKVEPCLSPIEPCLSPCLSPIPPNERGCGGDNDPGMALTLLLPLGLRRRRDVFERIANVLPADVAAKVRSKLDEQD